MTAHKQITRKNLYELDREDLQEPQNMLAGEPEKFLTDKERQDILDHVFGENDKNNNHR